MSFLYLQRSSVTALYVSSQFPDIVVLMWQVFVLSDVGSQHRLVGPDVRGPAAPAGRRLPQGQVRPGAGGGRHRAQHFAAKAEQQHLVSHIRTSSK